MDALNSHRQLTDQAPPLLQMQGIRVRFGSLIANNNVDFSISAGEVHALLGENGAGKTTLMKVLVGLVEPEEGRILLEGQEVQIRSAVQAMNHNIGMVHQHFMLIPTLTVAQNVALGLQSKEFFPDLGKVGEGISSLADQYNLQVDPGALVASLSVGEQQRVEIIKALYRGARLLVLDEPTSVLTPQEVENLFLVLRRLAEASTGIIFISHKLNEIMRISDQITVLRQGRVVATRRVTETNPSELARLMIGHEIDLPHVTTPLPPDSPLVLGVQGLTYTDERSVNILKGMDLDIRQGEIHGLAGVDGNGQEQLAKVLAGLLLPGAGRVTLNGLDITRFSPAQRIRMGMAHIPGNRQHTGLVLDLSISDNLVMEVVGYTPYSRYGFLNFAAIHKLVSMLVQSYDVRYLDLQQLANTLSGGNQQKLVLARELFRDPTAIIAVQPTRGLDVGAIEFVHARLLEQRQRGCTILLISTELDEILALSDRISVVYEGRIMGSQTRQAANIETLGLWMAGKVTT